MFYNIYYKYHNMKEAEIDFSSVQILNLLS